MTDSSDTTASVSIINTIKQLLTTTGLLKITGLVSLNIPNIYGSLEYLDSLTPGIIALTIFFGSVMTTGSAIAEEKESGTLVRMMMTPISKVSLFSENYLSANTGISQSCYPDTCSRIPSGIPYKWELASCCSGTCPLILGGVLMQVLLCYKGFSMESFDQLAMLVTMPSMFLTGVFFPLSSAPIWSALVSCVPLTYAIDAMRTIMVKGQDLNAISYDLMILVFFAIITFTLGVRLFRREA